MALDTDVPPWLAQALGPAPPQSPWILQAMQQGMQREEMKRKLPLQLQQMALENQANALAIEHRAILNDMANEEMRAFAEDLPVYRGAIEQATKTPGGALAMGTPVFKSKKALDLWQERQKSDAATAYGQAIHQAQIDQFKAATEAMRLTGRVIKPRGDGQFDPEELAALLNAGSAVKVQQEREKARANDPLALHTEYLTGLGKAYNDAVDSGDAAAISEAKFKMETAQTLALKDNMSFEITYDENGRAVIRMSRGKQAGTASDLERSTKGDLERKIAAGLTSLSLIDESLQAINPATVGPVGVAREFYEKGANIIKPGSAPTTTTEARQKFRITAQQQYASLKADSQINKLEAAAMKDIADITGVDIASDVGKQKYQTLRDLTSLQVILRAKEAGKPVPDQALLGMSLGYVSRSWKRKELTDADVERWNVLNGVVK